MATAATHKHGFQRLLEMVQDDAERPSLMGDIEPLRADPARLFEPLNMKADDWQKRVLRSRAAKLLLLCSRQSGKSQIMSAMALLEAILNPYAEVLIISKTLRQSTELLLKVKMLWRGLTGGKVHRRSWNPRSLLNQSLVEMQRVQELGWDEAALIQLDRSVLEGTKDKALSMDFPNGSRVTSLPGNPDTIVGFSAVTLLNIDEASRVSDALYNLVRPFLSATQAVHGRPGRLVVASTPYGKRGWFYEAWQSCEKAHQAYDQGRAEAGKADGGLLHSKLVDRRGEGEVHHGSYQGTDTWLRGHWEAGYQGRPEAPPFETYRVTADQCPRITREFLDEERAMIGEKWWKQEYFCTFVDSIDSVFSHDLIHSMVQPGEGEKRLWFED